MESSGSDRIQVRKVTDVHANWSEQGSGQPGKFSYQFILDDGAEEYVARPEATAAKTIVELLGRGEDVVLDTERGILHFARITD